MVNSAAPCLLKGGVEKGEKKTELRGEWNAIEYVIKECQTKGRSQILICQDIVMCLSALPVHSMISVFFPFPLLQLVTKDIPI